MTAVPVQFGQHPPADAVIVHVSDTHLLAGNRGLGPGYDTQANLVRTMQAIADLGVRPDAIVFTGDLTDLGEPEAYRALRATVQPLVESWGVPVIWVAGNHDERAPMRAELLYDGSGHTDGGPDAPITGVWDLGGLRLIALDTSVPGWHHGDIDDAQLEWLRAELSTPASRGTLLAMHHPPLPSHLPFFDILELRNQPRLAEVVRDSDVRGILAGHLHYSTSGMFAGVPVSVSAATCYTMNLARPTLQVGGMDAGQSFHLVHVYNDTITHSVVPVGTAATDVAFSEEWFADMAKRSPEERLELFSRKPPR